MKFNGFNYLEMESDLNTCSYTGKCWLNCFLFYLRESFPPPNQISKLNVCQREHRHLYKLHSMSTASMYIYIHVQRLRKKKGKYEKDKAKLLLRSCLYPASTVAGMLSVDLSRATKKLPVSKLTYCFVYGARCWKNP